MHTEAINQKTKRVLENIGSHSFILGFYLAGGTSLAIQMGHRKSLDLDFFSNHSFSAADIKRELSASGKYLMSYEDEKTLDGVLDGVKISFFRYDYESLYPLIDFGKIKLADIRDITAMKIAALSSACYAKICNIG